VSLSRVCLMGERWLRTSTRRSMKRRGGRRRSEQSRALVTRVWWALSRRSAGIVTRRRLWLCMPSFNWPIWQLHLVSSPFFLIRDKWPGKSLLNEILNSTPNKIERASLLRSTKWCNGLGLTDFSLIIVSKRKLKFYKNFIFFNMFY